MRKKQQEQTLFLPLGSSLLGAKRILNLSAAFVLSFKFPFKQEYLVTELHAFSCNGSSKQSYFSGKRINELASGICKTTTPCYPRSACPYRHSVADDVSGIVSEKFLLILSVSRRTVLKTRIWNTARILPHSIPTYKIVSLTFGSDGNSGISKSFSSHPVASKICSYFSQPVIYLLLSISCL